MKDYLLDTNMAGPFALLKSGIKNEKTDVLASTLQTLPKNAKIFFSAVTVGEIEYGLRVTSKSNIEEIKLILEFLRSQPILEINEHIASSSYSLIRANLFKQFAPKKGKKKKRIEEWKDPTTSLTLGIQENDVWITATAHTYNLILVSDDNLQQIKSIIDIEIQNWLKA